MVVGFSVAFRRECYSSRNPSSKDVTWWNFTKQHKSSKAGKSSTSVRRQQNIQKAAFLLKNQHIWSPLNRPKNTFKCSQTQTGFRDGLTKAFERFWNRKIVSEGPKTLKEFPIIASSETEKVFQRKESVFEIRKFFSVSKFDTIESSWRVFEPSKTLFSIRKPSEGLS